MGVLKVGLVGLGFMGSAHLNNYIELEKNGASVKLVAVCDVDEKKLKGGSATKGNLDVTGSEVDLSIYKLYTDMEEMIKNEELDYVDIALPTYLHAPMAVKAMKLGVHVLCEKPMAISSAACQEMIDTSKATGKNLMIAHTLRYWNAYEYAKELIDSKKFGECVCAYFYRGGETPIWSWENWLLQKDKSGGCLLDQHVHDVDTINWLFGVPSAVSSIGRVVNKGNGYDCVSTNYIYDSGVVVNAQDDWTINGKGYGFEMLFRMNFEKGALIFEKGKLTEHPVEGEAVEPKLHDENGYYKEMRLFVEALSGSGTLDFLSLLESHMQTIKMAEAEIKSCDNKGEVVKLG